MTTTTSPAMNELGFYALAGQPRSPRDLIDEVRTGEQLGLGAAFVSERFNVKEAAALSGAAGAASERLGIATAATNHSTRHPMVTASFASTMHFLTGGRFTLGLGRGIAPLMDAYGIPRATTAQMADAIRLMRRLWRGELVLGHDGPCGSYPFLHLDADFDEHIPVGLTAFGPRSLAFAGGSLDCVVLHTFFTDETTARAVATVRRAAAEAGRDPASVRVWACLATVGDHLPADTRLRKTVGRMGSYLQGYGDLLVSTNRWDPAVLERFRADPVVASVPGSIDAKATTGQLAHIAELIPEEWLAPSATGSAEQCARAVLAQFDLGVDGVILHGASPDELAPVVEAYAAVRPAGRFDHLAANPGLAPAVPVAGRG